MIEMHPEVEAWLNKAEEDWQSALWLLSEESPVTTPGVFHLQQAVEKWLKAYLVFRGIRFERKHDLRYLAELSHHDNILEHCVIFDELTPYAVEIRYPGDISAISKGDAFGLLEKVRLFREDICELYDSL